MKAPPIDRIVPPYAHPLRGMRRAGPLAELPIGQTGDRIAGDILDAERCGRRRHLVVVGIACTRPCREIELGNLPGCESQCRMFREGRRIRRQRQCGFGGTGHRAMVTVLPRHIEEGGYHDIGPVLAIGPNEPFDQPLLAPSPQGVVAILGEPEIVNRVFRSMTEPCHIRIDATGRFLHLGRPEHAERATPLRPESVLATLASGRTGDHDPHAIGKAQGCQHAIRLVVRMRSRIHDGQHGRKPAQCTMQADKSRLMNGARETAMVIQQERSPHSVVHVGSHGRYRDAEASFPGAARRRHRAPP